MTISYLIMFLGMENHSAHGMQNSYSDNLLMMLIGMGVGFLVALPINYYILTKTGKACHTKTNLPGEQ